VTNRKRAARHGNPAAKPRWPNPTASAASARDYLAKMRDAEQVAAFLTNGRAAVERATMSYEERKRLAMAVQAARASASKSTWAVRSVRPGIPSGLA